MELNVHNHTLDDTFYEIIYNLNICKETNDFILKIIHGYKHGKRIREYICNPIFLGEVAQKGYNIRIINTKDPGITIFEIIPINKLEKFKEPSYFCNQCKKHVHPKRIANRIVCPLCGRFKTR